MFKTIINAWKVPEVRKRLLFTLLLLVIFRLGTHISVPFVNFETLNTTMQNGQSGVMGLVNLITGGAFSRLSIFALSISPYISASIIIQLLGMLIPSIEVMMKEGGEQAKSKINKLTKIITLILAGLQGTGLYISYSYAENGGLFTPIVAGQLGIILTGIVVVSAFIAGTSFLVWLGEQITNKGIGNGVSLLIFAGIVAGIPNYIVSLITGIMINGQLQVQNLIIAIAMLISVLVLVTSVVYVHIAERKIPIQYARKIVGRKMYGGQNTYIPIKPVMAGVMPVIFASSFVTFPAMIIQIFFANQIGTNSFADKLYTLSIAATQPGVGFGYIALHAIIYMILILGFTFFYTLSVFNPAEIATNIKQNGGYIPGVRAGKPTVEYLTNTLVKLTTFGGLFLCAIVLIPMIATMSTGIEIAFGGTSILIIVGVAIETVQQLESQLMMKHYKGFLG